MRIWVVIFIYANAIRPNDHYHTWCPSELFKYPSWKKPWFSANWNVNGTSCSLDSPSCNRLHTNVYQPSHDNFIDFPGEITSVYEHTHKHTEQAGNSHVNCNRTQHSKTEFIYNQFSFLSISTLPWIQCYGHQRRRTAVSARPTSHRAVRMFRNWAAHWRNRNCSHWTWDSLNHCTMLCHPFRPAGIWCCAKLNTHKNNKRKKNRKKIRIDSL